MLTGSLLCMVTVSILLHHLLFLLLHSLVLLLLLLLLDGYDSVADVDSDGDTGVTDGVRVKSWA